MKSWKLLLVFAGLMGCCGGCLTIWEEPAWWKDLWGDRFDADAWRAGARGRRTRMLPNLIRRHRMVGMTTDEFQLLLGPPNQPDVKDGRGRYVYHISDGDFFGTWGWPHLILVVEQGTVLRVDQADSFMGEIVGRVVRQE